jgi:opacity protein-like surface antigen
MAKQIEVSGDEKMKMVTKLAGVAAVGVLGLQAVPALAQDAGKQEVSVYAGALFGDDVTDRRISGQQPKLDDDFTYGLRYGYNLTDQLGLELSVGQSPNSVKNVPGGDIDLDLTTFDVDAVWNFRNSTRLYPYVFAGVGYAIADLDHRINGTVGLNQPVSITDDNGFTLNAGVGARYDATDHFFVRAEARYRYLDKVVDHFDDSLNTVETTLGVGYRF